jgi:hypothetical protein
VAQRVRGRTRHVLVDVMGFVLAVCVHAADVQDRAGARPFGEATELTSVLRLPATSEAVIYGAMSRLMLRCLTP